MKQKRSLIIAVFIAVLLIGLLVWRATPRSLESLTGPDFDRTVSVSAYTESSKFVNGTDVFIRYRLDGEDTRPGGEHFDPLLELFRDIKARPSLTNLLRPRLLSGSFSWTGSIDFLYGFVSCGGAADMFTLTNRGKLLIGSCRYFLTDENQFTALWEYVTTHGAENIS